MADTTLFVNPACSTCRTAQGLLAEAGIEAEVVRYLDRPPSLAELKVLMAQLGVDDPRAMMRSKEHVYAELGLAEKGGDDLLRAISEYPILLERPILVRNGRAVIARPPERIFELM